MVIVFVVIVFVVLVIIVAPLSFLLKRLGQFIRLSRSLLQLVHSAVVEERMHSPNGREDDEDDACDLPAGNCTPSYAGSCVEQGLPRGEQSQEILVQKTWTGTRCSEGVWVHETRGRGVADEDKDPNPDEVPDNGNDGHFGVLVGNWGGKFKEPTTDA